MTFTANMVFGVRFTLLVIISELFSLTNISFIFACQSNPRNIKRIALISFQPDHSPDRIINASDNTVVVLLRYILIDN